MTSILLEKIEQRGPVTWVTHATVLLLFGAAAVLVVLLGLSRPDGIAIWPAGALGCGIGLGMICRFGSPVLPTVLIGILGAGLLSDVSFGPLAGVALAQGVATYLGWTAMQRLGFARDMCRFRDFLIFAAIGPGAVALITAVAATGLVPDLESDVWLGLARTWLACAAGCMLVAPALLIDDSSTADKQPTRGGWGLIICVGLLMLVSQMRGLPESVTAAMSWALFGTAALGAMFHGARIVTLMLLVAGLSAIAGAGLSVGPFDHPADASERVLILVKICMLAFTALGVGVMRAERQRLFARDSERLQRIVASGQRYAGDDVERRIAGDLNQPLSAIRTYAQTATRVLRRGGLGERDTTLEQALSEIVSGTERAAGIVRPEHEGPLPRTEVGELIRQSLREAEWELASRGIRLRRSVESDLPPILVAEDELERIVLLGLHASIGRALVAQRRRELCVRCRHDDRACIVELEFRVRNGETDRDDGPILRPEWRAGLERLEARGGFFRVAEGSGWQSIRIGMPVASDHRQRPSRGRP